jgi:DNA-binding transcriptional ArsR family regulator
MLGRRERIVTPEGEGHRFAELCFALSSGTRLDVLQVLVGGAGPMHIREIARRVHADPSPVRTHLDLLVKVGLARELPEPGRERRFVTDVSGLRLVLTPPDRPSDVDPRKEPSRAIRRKTDRIKELEAKVHKLEREIAELADERAEMWRKGEQE